MSKSNYALFRLDNFVSTLDSFNFIYINIWMKIVIWCLNRMSAEISFTNIKPFCFTWLTCTFISENSRELWWTGNLIFMWNNFSKIGIELCRIPTYCDIRLLGKRISKKNCDLFMADSVICTRDDKEISCLIVSLKWNFHHLIRLLIIVQS